MADEETTQTEEQEPSTNLVFSEDEIADLEKEFKADVSPEDEGKEAEEDDDEQEEGDEESLDGFDTDEEADDDESDSDEDDTDGDEESGETGEDEAEEDEEEDEGFTLLVEGKTHQVENVDQLAALAQKGIFYEKRATESKRALENANFTMRAMINDHFGFLEEFYTQKFGNYESARKHVAELAHAYVVPYYKELQAEPEAQKQLQENRQLKRQARGGQQNGNGQQKTERTYTQAEIEQLQTLEHNVSVALDEVGLPKDSDPLRKRMADIMLAAMARDETMHPLTAAKHLLRERKALQKELSRTVPKGRKRGKSGKQKKADIAVAKTRRSRKKSGTSEQRGERKVKTQRTYTGREFINSLNDAMGLEH
ncbi:MAG: hypothetical protein KAJ42_15330 [Gemmatimonadetes bacterium]|nr:hypothetical protein [Gemmatimonadota bacterium]